MIDPGGERGDVAKFRHGRQQFIGDFMRQRDQHLAFGRMGQRFSDAFGVVDRQVRKARAQISGLEMIFPFDNQDLHLAHASPRGGRAHDPLYRITESLYHDPKEPINPRQGAGEP